jgi:hypothetical protein
MINDEAATYDIKCRCDSEACTVRGLFTYRVYQLRDRVNGRFESCARRVKRERGVGLFKQLRSIRIMCSQSET